MKNTELYEKMDKLGVSIEDVNIQLIVYIWQNTREVKEWNAQTNGVYEYVSLQDIEHIELTYSDIERLEYVANCTECNAFSFGTIASSAFDISMYEDIGDTNYSDYDFSDALVIPVYFFYHNDERFHMQQLGVFHVETSEKEDDMIKLHCRDNVYLLDKYKPFYFIYSEKDKNRKADLIKNYETISMKAIFKTCVNDCVRIPESLIDELTDKFDNMSLKCVKKMYKWTSRKILGLILDVNAAFGYFDEYGEFRCKEFDKNNEPVAIIPYDEVMEFKLDGYSAIMNCINIESEDNVAYSCSWSPKYIDEQKHGKLRIPLPFTEDNPILSGVSDADWDDFPTEYFENTVRNFNFRPGEVSTCIPDFRIEPGDFVLVEDKYGYGRKLLVSQLTYKDNLEMQIISAWDKETYKIEKDGSVFLRITFEAVNGFSFIGDVIGIQAWESDYTIKSIVFKHIDNTPNKEDYPYAKMFAAVKDDSIIVSVIDERIDEDDYILFHQYQKIEKIDLSGLDTSKFKYMGYMFERTATESDHIEIVWGEDFDTSNVEDMRNMFSFFAGSANSISLDLSSFDTSNVENMSLMFNFFAESANNISLDLSSFDTSNVQYMNNMFSYFGRSANSISLDLSSFDTSNVKDMGGMFSYFGRSANNISLDLSSFDTSNVQYMNNMFENAGKNSTNFVLKLGKKFKIAKSDIYPYEKQDIFYGSGITKIICPATLKEEIQEIFTGVIETY